MRRPVSAPLAAVLSTGIFALSGCGGGGGGSSAPAISGGSTNGTLPNVPAPPAVPTAPPTFAPTLTEYRVNPKAGPAEITVGPDGNMYYTEGNNAAIGKITPAGVASDIPVPQSIGQLGITTGPDNALWFVDQTPFIGRLDLSGNVTVIPSSAPPNGLSTIKVGSDRNMWFGGGRSSVGIGVVSPASRTIIQQYALPSNGTVAADLILANDGNLWGPDFLLNGIYRITPAGSATFFPVPTGNVGLQGMTNGPDGSLWFGEGLTSKIGHITTSGTYLAEVPLPFNDTPLELVFAPNGKLYVTVINPLRGSAIDEIDPLTGTAARFQVSQVGIRGIVVGPDSNVWVLEQGVVGKLTIH